MPTWPGTVGRRPAATGSARPPGHCAGGWSAADCSRPTPPWKSNARRSPRRLPVALTDTQLGAVLAAASTPDPIARRPWPERDRALVAVLAGAGVRASELCSADLPDLIVDSDAVLRVRGKGNKDRVIPLPHEVLTVITDYLPSRTTRADGNQTALFLNSKGQRLGRRALDHLVTSWFTRAGVPQPPGEAAHAFRHTYAFGLVANGAALPAVQELLGHSNLATTSVYLRATAAHLQETVRALPVRGMLSQPTPADRRGHAHDPDSV